MRIVLTLIGLLLMVAGLLIEAVFVFGHLASGIGLIDNTMIMLCGPLLFFSGLGSLLFSVLGKGVLAFILAAIAMFVGVSWTVFNFSYDK